MLKILILRGVAMSFVLNGCQQISLFDSLGFMSERKQRMLDKSWAKPFSEHIFNKISNELNNVKSRLSTRL